MVVRVVIGKRKGIKCRVKFPSMMYGHITYTFYSVAEAKRFIKGLNRWQRDRAKLTLISSKMGR